MIAQNRTYMYKVGGKEHRINGKKPLGYALKTALPGLGSFLCAQICDQLGVPSTFSLNDLTPRQRASLFRMLADHYVLGPQVKFQVEDSIERYLRIGSYRGARLRDGLPVRGQRTRTNAYTARKKVFVKQKK